MTRREIEVASVPTHVTTPLADEVERTSEATLRPTTLGDFVGQSELVGHLAIVLGAAQARGQCVDHLLFAGPPGLGKTSLATIVAREMGTALRVTSGPVLARPGDLAALLSDLHDGDVLFIDEIHRLSRTVEEVLYPAMEDRRLDVMIGRGPSARSIRLDLPPFTLVGATTRTGLVAAPLRDRFGFVGQLDLYGVAELRAVVERSSALLGVALSGDAAEVIARRSRGTPRIANRLLRRVRDVAAVRGASVVDTALAGEALDLFGVDERGLDLSQHPGARLWRGDRHHRRRLRTVPVARGIPHSNPARSGRHRPRLRPPGPTSSGRGTGLGALQRATRVSGVLYGGTPHVVDRDNELG